MGQGPIIHNGSKRSVSSPLNKKDASLLFFFLAKFDRDVDVDGGTFRVSTAKPITSRDGAYLLCLEGSKLEEKNGVVARFKGHERVRTLSPQALRRPSIDPRHTGPALQCA